MNKYYLLISIFFLTLKCNLSISQENCKTNEWLEEELRKNDEVYLEIKDSTFFEEYDYSSIFLSNEEFNLGFIGINKQRLNYVFKTSQRNPRYNNIYWVSGITNVKENICQFHGIISIEKVYYQDSIRYGFEEEIKGVEKPVKQGVIYGRYVLYENSNENNTGFFEGVFLSRWYVNQRGELKYDDIYDSFDNYSNNLFKGTWTSYTTHKSKLCNWGQYRIPCSGDLDIGAAEFIPNKKYYNVGWNDYNNTNINDYK